MMKQIEIMVDEKINQIPKPQMITITKVYDDDVHVDAKTDNDEELTYIATIGTTPVKDQKGILLFLENDEIIIIT